MKKRFVITSLIAAALVISCALGISASAQKTGEGTYNANQAFQWGESLKSVQNNKKVIARVSDIDVAKSEVDTVIQNNKAAGITKSSGDALKVAIKQDALYAKAVKNGFSVTEKELQAYIDRARDMTDHAGNYHVFSQYLKGAGITENEYWEGQRDSYRKGYTIQKWLDSIRSSDQKYKDDAVWNAYVQQLCDRVIHDARIIYIK